MNEKYDIPANVIKLIAEHSASHGQAKSWTDYYQENGHMPDDFLNTYYSKFDGYSLAGNAAVEGLCDPQPLLF